MKGQAGPCSTVNTTRDVLVRAESMAQRRKESAVPPVLSMNGTEAHQQPRHFWLVVSAAGFSLAHVKVMQ